MKPRFFNQKQRQQQQGRDSEPAEPRSALEIYREWLNESSGSEPDENDKAEKVEKAGGAESTESTESTESAKSTTESSGGIKDTGSTAETTPKETRSAEGNNGATSTNQISAPEIPSPGAMDLAQFQPTAKPPAQELPEDRATPSRSQSSKRSRAAGKIKLKQHTPIAQDRAESPMSTSRSPSRILQTPRKIMQQMPFRAMLSPSPKPSSTVLAAQRQEMQTPRSPHPSKGAQDTSDNGESVDGAGGMGTLFSDAWIARPSATRQETERVAKAAPIYPISSRTSTLYDVPLDKDQEKAQTEEKPQAYVHHLDASGPRRRPSVGWEYYQPDGRSGWWVVCCAFFACSVSLSTLLNYTVYEEYYLATNVAATGSQQGLFWAHFNDAATLTDIHLGVEDFVQTHWRFSHRVSVYAVFIGTLMSAFAALFSLPAGLLADISGHQPCALGGTLVMAIGLFSSSFIDRLWALCLTQGVLCGIGIALVLLPAYTAPALWFERRRAVATGVAVSGAAVGVLVLTPVYTALLRRHGMATSLRVQALIVLVLGCVASLGLRKRVAGASALPMRWREKLGDVRVWALMAMAFFAAASRFAQLLCFPAFARASGLTDASATNVLYALGATFLAGSIAGGLVADRSGYVGGIGLSELVMGFFTLVLWAPSSSPAPMYIYAVLFGLCSGALAALLPAAVAQLLGAPRLASSLGLVIAVSMPAILITAPAAIRFLALADQKRSTAWLAAVSGVLSLIAGFIGLTLPLLQRRHLHKEVQREAADAFPVPPSRPSA